MEASESQVTNATAAEDSGGADADADADDGGADDSASVQRLTDRLDKFMDAMEKPSDGDRGGLLDSVRGGQDDDDDDEYEYDDEYDDDDDDDEGAYPADEEQQARQLLEEFVDGRLQERLAPYLREQYEEKRIEQVRDLESRYSELRDPEVASPLVQLAEKVATDLGEPALAYEAPFLETVHLRMKAEAAQSAEREGGEDREAPVESGGGSAPRGDSKGEEELVDLIVKAGKPKSIFG